LTCKWTSHDEGERALATILSIHFWNWVVTTFKVLRPLVHVLCRADADKKPTMGNIQAMMRDARKEIVKAYDNYNRKHKPILDIIDENPLHVAN